MFLVDEDVWDGILASELLEGFLDVGAVVWGWLVRGISYNMCFGGWN